MQVAVAIVAEEHIVVRDAVVEHVRADVVVRRIPEAETSVGVLERAERHAPREHPRSHVGVFVVR